MDTPDEFGWDMVTGLIVTIGSAPRERGKTMLMNKLREMLEESGVGVRVEYDKKPEKFHAWVSEGTQCRVVLIENQSK